MQNYYSGHYYSERYYSGHYYSENYYPTENYCSIDCCYSSQCYSAVHHPIAVYYPVFRFLYQNHTDIHCPGPDRSVQEFLMCCLQSAGYFPTYSPNCSDSTAVPHAIASCCFLHFPTSISKPPICMAEIVEVRHRHKHTNVTIQSLL